MIYGNPRRLNLNLSASINCGNVWTKPKETTTEFKYTVRPHRTRHKCQLAKFCLALASMWEPPSCNNSSTQKKRFIFIIKLGEHAQVDLMNEGRVVTEFEGIKVFFLMFSFLFCRTMLQNCQSVVRFKCLYLSKYCRVRTLFKRDIESLPGNF